MAKSKSVTEVIRRIESGQRIFVHGGAATPNALLKELVAQSDRLKDVELIHLHTEGEALYARKAYKDAFSVVNLFVGANVRGEMDHDRVDYLPCTLSEMPRLLRSRRRPIDVALLHLSPPDAHGFCTLGTSVDIARAAIEVAQTVIAQINPRMPRVHGDTFIHISEVDHWTEVDEPLPEAGRRPPTEIEKEIGRQVTTLVDDGACLQVGIGAVPDAVLGALACRRHLGIHSEMWSDGVLDLIRCGAIDNSRKKVHAGKSVSTFLMGSKAVYDYVNDNPAVIQLEADYVNNPAIIARNPNVVAINSAVEIDLTGQVCADSVGPRIISGAGGQLDFMRGASLSPGGKPIIALTSRTRSGASRIVASLQAGAGVVTTRTCVHYIVTEYGIADLFGKTLGERVRELVRIAHPDDREALMRGWRTKS